MLLYHRCNDGVDAVMCSSGSFSSADKLSCELCPAGHYCPTDGLAAPILCVNGTYQNETGETSCLQCPAGKLCQPVSSTPSDCPNGTYSSLGVAECLACPSGYR